MNNSAVRLFLLALLLLAAWFLLRSGNEPIGNLPGLPPADEKPGGAAPSAPKPRLDQRQATREGIVSGRVVHVGDGDTLTIQLPDGERQRVRLAWIDAPESDQAYGEQAKEALDRKVYRREVTVQLVDRDQYGRIVGLVRLGDRDINSEMVAEGWAWNYRHYSHSRELAALEQAARDKRLGLWADEHPMPPWDFRQTEPEREKRRRRQHDERPIPSGALRFADCLIG